MKRNMFTLGVVFVLLASACSAQSTPTANPADIANTAQAAAFTIVAQTQQAIPTLTPVPPTQTPSPTIAPTNTLLPLTLTTPGTQEGLPTTGVAVGFTSLPTFTPQVASGSGSSGNQDPCNQPLTKWQGPTANFTVSNQTKPKGTIILSMYVVSDMGQCGYLIITGDSFSGPAGQYSAGAFITGKKDMKSFGSFSVKGGNWKIVVKNDNITASGSCYPNC